MKLAECKAALKRKNLVTFYGKVDKIVGLMIESTGPLSNIGDVCRIYSTVFRKTLTKESSVTQAIFMDPHNPVLYSLDLRL